MKRKLVSTLVKAALCMIIIPLITITAGAAVTQYVYTAADLEKALTAQTPVDVVLKHNITGTLAPEKSAEKCIRLAGVKTLDLNGYSIDVTAGNLTDATLIYIGKDTQLTVKDSTDSGARIFYDGYINDNGSYRFRRVIWVDGGTFNLESGTISAGRSKLGWCYTHAHNIRREVFGTGIYVQGNSASPSTVNIYGGCIEGRGHVPAADLPYDRDQLISVDYPVYVSCGDDRKDAARVNIYGGELKGYGATSAIGSFGTADNFFKIYGGHFSTSRLDSVKIGGKCINISGTRTTGVTKDMVYAASQTVYNKGTMEASTDVTVTLPMPKFGVTSLPSAKAGQEYYADLKGSGLGELHYTVIEGSLPYGITLDPIKGIISGKTQRSGEGFHKFTVQVKDAYGNQYESQFSLWVNSPDTDDIRSEQSFSAKQGEYFFERFDLDTEYGEVNSMKLVSDFSKLPDGVEYGYSAEGCYLRGTPTASGKYYAVFIMERIEDSKLIYHKVELTVAEKDTLIPKVYITSDYNDDFTQIINCKVTTPKCKVTKTEYARSGKLLTSLEPGSKASIAFTLEADSGYALNKDTMVYWNGVPFTARIVSGDRVRYAFDVTVPILPTEGSESETAFPFTDVPESQWYYTWVKSAYEMGLIEGMTPTTFQPDGNMTYAQAITLAARMNQKYMTGVVTLQNGTGNWYDTYVDYCLKNNIIDSDYAGVINTKIDRHNFAHIFVNALPAEALKPINTIPYGSIPDVNSTYKYESDIYTLYRAGILNGSKSDGTFNPNSNIKRSEVAAILVRMMDPSVRVGPPADLAH